MATATACRPRSCRARASPSSGPNPPSPSRCWATGPDPIVSVNGQGSDAWRIQRLGATSRADASAGVMPTPQGMRCRAGRAPCVSQMPAVPQPLQDNGPPGVPADQPLIPGAPPRHDRSGEVRHALHAALAAPPRRHGAMPVMPPSAPPLSFRPRRPPVGGARAAPPRPAARDRPPRARPTPR